MSIEFPNQSQPEKSKALDETWYARFEKFASFEAYKYLDGDEVKRAKEKKLFLSGDKENPELDYPKLDLTQIIEREKELLALKNDVLDQEQNEVVKNVYRWRLNEKIAENRLLRAAAMGDTKRFSRYSEFMYGNPSPDIFAYTLARIHEEMRHYKEYGPRNVDPQEIDDFLKLLPDQKKPDFKRPSIEEVKKMGEKTKAELGDVLKLEDASELYTPTGLKKVFENALRELQDEGWIVVIIPGKVAISINQERKTVEIPDVEGLKEKREKGESLVKSVRGLIAHEIGTHAARRVRGERSKLKLLGLGLDRYEGGEEGIASLRQDAMEEKAEDYSGIVGHLAVGLAKGLDGHPRNFRELFTLLERYFYLNNRSYGDSKEDAKRKAVQSAWIAGVRTFRGTNAQTRGACFTKDIIYREGNIAVWEAVRRDTPEMHRWNVGKYDPSNPRHIWILDQLGITEKDLQDLEKP